MIHRVGGRGRDESRVTPVARRGAGRWKPGSSWERGGDDVEQAGRGGDGVAHALQGPRPLGVAGTQSDEFFQPIDDEELTSSRSGPPSATGCTERRILTGAERAEDRG